MKHIPCKVLAVFLVCLLSLTGGAQQTSPLPKQSVAVKRKAERLTPHAPISVIPRVGEEEYGTSLSHDTEAFTFYDVDRKTEVMLKYADVRKIKEGYGGYNSIRGRHTDRTRALIVAGAVVVALGGLIAAAAMAKN